MQRISRKLCDLEESKAETDSIFKCRGRLLSAKHELLMWERMNKKTQIDIAEKQVSILQTQLESKIADLRNITPKMVNNLPISDVMNTEVDQLKNELEDKENALKNSIEEIAKLDGEISIIIEQQNYLFSITKEVKENRNKKIESEETMEQYLNQSSLESPEKGKQLEHQNGIV